jgi:hypothetical protein
MHLFQLAQVFLTDPEQALTNEYTDVHIRCRFAFVLVLSFYQAHLKHLESISQLVPLGMANILKWSSAWLRQSVDGLGLDSNAKVLP